MRRRRLLTTSGFVLGMALKPYGRVSAVTPATTPTERKEPDPLEFEGEGVAITDEFEVKSGPVIVDSTHDGDSTFDVRAVPSENGQDYRLVTQTGIFDGTTGSFIEEGTYVLYVDADGEWTVTVRQPRVSETEADEPPISIDSSGSDWIGPILFDRTTRLAGRYRGESSFRVDLIPQAADDSEYLWEGGELIFNAIGPFEGITGVHTAGVGYLSVEGDGEWRLRIE